MSGEETLLECAICLASCVNPVTALCGAHNFCLECLQGYIKCELTGNKRPTCPTCRGPLQQDPNALKVNVMVRDLLLRAEALKKAGSAVDARSGKAAGGAAAAAVAPKPAPKAATAAPKAAAPSSSDWACSHCTFINSSQLALACEVCGGVRDGMAPSTAVAGAARAQPQPQPQPQPSQRRAGALSLDPATLPPGTRVRRGPTWQWHHQDCAGGEMGHPLLGTSALDEDAGWVKVAWDHSPHTFLSYRWAPAAGLRDVVPVGSGAPPALLALGTRVSRGPTWKWGDQDGNGHVGISSLDPDPGWVQCAWSHNPSRIMSYRYDLGAGLQDVLPLLQVGDAVRVRGGVDPSNWGGARPLERGEVTAVAAQGKALVTVRFPGRAGLPVGLAHELEKL